MGKFGVVATRSSQGSRNGQRAVCSEDTTGAQQHAMIYIKPMP